MGVKANGKEGVGVKVKNKGEASEEIGVGVIETGIFVKMIIIGTLVKVGVFVG